MKNKSTIYKMATYGIFTALLCIFAPMSVPIGPVPVTLTNLILYTAVFILGTRGTLVSYIIYLLLGIVGLPVFSGYAGGVAKVAGPTGGYLVGFILMILVSGIAVKFGKANPFFTIPAMILGTVIAYALGTAWFVFQMKTTFAGALSLCVYPFIPFDLAKIVIGTILGKAIRTALISAGLITVE